MAKLELSLGLAVRVPMYRDAKIVDLDPPQGLEGYVCVEIPGEIPPRWWVEATGLAPSDHGR